MRAWLPSVSLQETMICLTDGEAEGWLISVVWLGVFIELSLARRTRHAEGGGLD